MNIRKRGNPLISLSFSIAAFSMTGVSFSASARDLTFAMQDYPPFYYEENHEVKGAAQEITQKACDLLKIHCKFQVLTLARTFIQLRTGEIDGSPGLINDPKNNPERLAFINFSVPYLQSQQAYMGIKGITQPLQKVEDLEGWTIGTVRNSTSENILRKTQLQTRNINPIIEINIANAINKLAMKHYGTPNKAALLFNEDVVFYYAKKMGIDHVVTLLPQNKTRYSTGFSKQSGQDTVQSFDDAIKTLFKNGELQKIADRYHLSSFDPSLQEPQAPTAPIIDLNKRQPLN